MGCLFPKQAKKGKGHQAGDLQPVASQDDSVSNIALLPKDQGERSDRISAKGADSLQAEKSDVKFLQTPDATLTPSHRKSLTKVQSKMSNRMKENLEYCLSGTAIPIFAKNDSIKPMLRTLKVRNRKEVLFLSILILSRINELDTFNEKERTLKERIMKIATENLKTKIEKLEDSGYMKYNNKNFASHTITYFIELYSFLAYYLEQKSHDTWWNSQEEHLTELRKKAEKLSAEADSELKEIIYIHKTVDSLSKHNTSDNFEEEERYTLLSIDKKTTIKGDADDSSRVGANSLESERITKPEKRNSSKHGTDPKVSLQDKEAKKISHNYVRDMVDNVLDGVLYTAESGVFPSTAGDVALEDITRGHIRDSSPSNKENTGEDLVASFSRPTKASINDLNTPDDVKNKSGKGKVVAERTLDGREITPGSSKDGESDITRAETVSKDYVHDLLDISLARAKSDVEAGHSNHSGTTRPSDTSNVSNGLTREQEIAHDYLNGLYEKHKLL